ncbi:MAG TPA: tetratricopeptide repeat protein [Kofleriaceae bacterium]|nr:tetratricopeptide repeat protein [Kofleriaceae bacterium]
MGEPRRTRLPLQIGIQSLYSLAFASATLVPAAVALLATLFILVIKGGGIILLLLFSQGWVIAVGIIGIEVMLLVRGILHLRFALRTRPADAVFDDRGLHVEGGRLHGRSIAWSDCKAVREEKVGPADDEIGGSRAVIDRKQGEPLIVAEAEDESELASLRALCDSVRARLHPEALPLLPPEDRPDLLRCPSCAAAAAPIDADHTTCAYCSAQVPIPKALREKLRATEEVLASSKVSAPLLAKLLKQPSARYATLLSIVAGIPIAAMWILAVVFAVALYRHHGLRAINVVLLSVSALVTIAGCYYLLRFWFVNRMALSVITLSFGAFPPAKEGAPWTCRSCNAPLPPARSGLLARCAFCGSDNVQGIDLRPRAEGARKERATLESAFARRDKDRRNYALRAAAALVVLPISLWGFFRASKPVTREAKLLVACDRGELPVCVDLGRYYLETQTYNRDAAKRVFERACKRTSADACAELGALLASGDAKELARAVELTWSGCQANHAMSCTVLGNMIEGRRVSRTDLPDAVALYRRACDAGHAHGCATLAEHVFAGNGVPKDRAAGVKLFEQSCAAKDPFACADLAQLYFDGNGVPQDRARAIAMWSDACSTTPPTYAACSGLGFAYEKGLGVVKDRTRSWDLLRRSCEYGNVAAACTRVGEIQEAQERYDAAFEHYVRACPSDAGGCLGMASVEVKRGNASRGIALLRRSCTDDHVGEACTLGAIWLVNGKHGIAKDPAQAAELYAAGCNLDNASSCNLGGQLADTQQDYAAARRLLTRACDLGEASGCNFLGKELEDGLGGAADASAALAAYQRACDTPLVDDSHGAQAYGCAHEGLLARKLGDEPRAVSRLRKACDWESQPACDALQAAPDARAR